MKQLIVLFIVSVLIASCTNREINQFKRYWNDNIKNVVVSPFDGTQDVPFSSPVYTHEEWENEAPSPSR